MPDGHVTADKQLAARTNVEYAVVLGRACLADGDSTEVAAEHSAMPSPLLERLRRCRGGVQVDRVEATTHFAVMERPEQVGAILADFARERGRC